MAGLKRITTIARPTKLGGAAGPSGGIPRTPVHPKVASRPPTNPGRETLIPRGPAVLHLGQAPVKAPGGPGSPPAYFSDTATISNVEWVNYWASAKLFHDPIDPTQPPFTGARTGIWEYQIPELAGAPRSVGNSVTDFVYHLALGDILLLIDTFYYHIEGDPVQQARDQYIRQHAQHRNVEVRVLYDTQLLGDATGAAAIKALADVLGGRELISPTRSGLAYAPRNLVLP